MQSSTLVNADDTQTVRGFTPRALSLRTKISEHIEKSFLRLTFGPYAWLYCRVYLRSQCACLGWCALTFQARQRSRLARVPSQGVPICPKGPLMCLPVASIKDDHQGSEKYGGLISDDAGGIQHTIECTIQEVDIYVCLVPSCTRRGP